MNPTSEASRRRRLVFNGLRDRLGDGKAEFAMILCDREFADQPVFSVKKFCDRLVEADQSLLPQYSGLFKALLQLRNKELSDLGPDPRQPETPEGTRAGRAILAAEAVRTGDAARAAVFGALLAEIGNRVRLKEAEALDRLQRFLRTRSGELSLRRAAVEGVNAFADFGRTAFDPSVGHEELHAIVHEIYRWCCDEFGPVDADRIFGRSVREVEAMPEAEKYPPRSLL